MNVSYKNILVIGLLATSLVACGSNMQGYSSTSEELTQKSEPIVVDEGVSEKVKSLIEEVNNEEQLTDSAYSEIAKQEKKLKTINILSFLLALPFKATDSEETVREKIKNPVKELLGKVRSVVDKAYALDDSIREKLELIAAELDKNIPSHADALKKIDKLHSKLDGFEEKVDKAVTKLEGSVDGVIKKIEAKIASYIISFDPRALLLKKVQEYFDDLRDDLKSHLKQ